jgi:hydroxymethylbilane synthase
MKGRIISMKRVIRVGTRESTLAVVQSKWVINEIKNKFPSLEFELIGIKTMGDLILDKRLDKIGGKGLFIKELESALMNNTIDLAVHSMKDMPAELPEELTIAAVSKREDPRDVLVTSDGKTLEQLKAGAVIGTSSVRREVQLKELKQNLEMKTLRGNVLTRLNKLQNGEYDGILLAMAGLKRLELEDKAVQCFSISEMIPAVGQGALGIEARKGDDLDYLLESINDEECALAVRAERAFMIKLNGSCSTPIAAHAVIKDGVMKVYGMSAMNEKAEAFRAYVEGSKLDAVALGEKLAEMIIERRKK